jgi:large subunit ribosomal protein L14
MICIGMCFRVVDNSGAKKAKCIKIFSQGKRFGNIVGTVVLVTLKNFIDRKRVNKRIIYLGLVVGIASWVPRLEGSFIKFSNSRVLIFNQQYKFLGTRVLGILFKEIRYKVTTDKVARKNYQKIISYSSLLI